MPPRDPSLPEGTDHVFDTNADSSNSSGGGNNAGGGAAGTSASTGSTGGTGGSASTGDEDSSGGSTSGGGENGGSAFKFDKGEGADADNKSSGIMGQVKDQISSLKSQAGERARGFADDSKSRATDFLSTLASIVADAAGSVEDKLGSQYSGFGNKASDSIQSLASSLDERSVDDLIEDARAFVTRSPVLAVGIAAVLGFAVARVVRAGVTEYRGGGEDQDSGTAATGKTQNGATA